MDKIAKLSDAERLELFHQTSTKLNIPTAMVEKDFWVCWVLERIFSDKWLSQVLRFRGGTSLSKGYNLIDRFSEDIDITLDKSLVLTDEQSKTLLRSKTSYKDHKQEISHIAAEYISTKLKDKIVNVLNGYVQIFTDEEYEKHTSATPGLARAGMMIAGKPAPTEWDNKNLHITYPKVANDTYLRSDILLEVGILSALTPNEPKEISPYIAKTYQKLNIAPAIVPTIKAKRTFWDKATILHREHYRPATKHNKETGIETSSHTPERYSRHYYDLYQMGKSETKAEALADFTLLKEVIEYKNKFYPCGFGQTFDDCAVGSLCLLPNENNLESLARDYKSMQGMIFGDTPTWEEILTGLQELETEINKKGKNGN